MRPDPRTLRWAGGSAIVLAAVGLLAWEPLPPGVWHDDGVYLMTGASIAEGHGLRYHGVPDAPEAAKFPPLYPAVVAAVWAVTPEFPANLPWLVGLNLVFVALAGGAATALFHRATGLARPLASAAAVAIFLAPIAWRPAVIPLSEPLFVLFMMVALGLGTVAERDPRLSPALGVTAIVVLACYTRSVGVVLAVALAAGILWHGRRYPSASAEGAAAPWSPLVRAGVVAGGVAAALVPWIRWSSAAGRSIPEPLADVLGPYGPWVGDQLRADPLGYAAHVGRNSIAVASVLADPLSGGLPGWPGRVLAIGVGLAVVIGAARLFGRSPSLVLAMVGYIGVVAMWPFGASQRLVGPVWPLVGACALVGAVGLPGRGGRVAPVVLVGLWAVGGAGGLARGEHTSAYRLRSASLTEAMTIVRDHTPPGAVVGAPELWPVIPLYTGRSSAPSARFRPLSSGEPAWGSPEEQVETWRAAGVDHVLVEHGGRVHGEALDALDAACPGAVRLLASYDSGFLVGVELGTECVDAFTR